MPVYGRNRVWNLWSLQQTRSCNFIIYIHNITNAIKDLQRENSEVPEKTNQNALILLFFPFQIQNNTLDLLLTQFSLA